jgi:nucleoside phosphorylase
MKPPCDLLILAAFPPELAPLKDVLGEGLRRSFGGHEVAAATVGVGMVQAAAGAARIVGMGRPARVVLVGTCGGFGDAIGVGDVAVAGRIVLAEPAVVRGEGAYPEPMVTELLADEGMATELVARGGKRVGVATTLAVTTDDGLAERLSASTGCGVEHLEAFGVATTCAMAGVPFVSVLGVANRVGSTGRSEWRENHVRASAAAIDLLVRWMVVLSGEPSGGGVGA